MAGISDRFLNNCSEEVRKKYKEAKIVFENFKTKYKCAKQVEIDDDKEQELFYSIFLFLQKGNIEQSSNIIKSNIINKYAENNKELESLLDELIESCHSFLMEIPREQWESVINEFQLGTIKKAKRRTKNKKNIKSGSKGRSKSKQQHIPDFLKARGKKEYMQKVLEAIRRSDMLEGMQDAIYLTYEKIDEEGFYNVDVKSVVERITSSEFINRDWLANGYKCDILSGGIGSGKTILIYRVAESLLKQKADNFTILISACDQDRIGGDLGMKYFQAFREKKIPKRGKLVVIVDGLDELIERKLITNYEQLFDAADYYNATLIINCRSSLVSVVRKNVKNKIDCIWKMMRIGNDEIEPTVAEYLEGTGVSNDVITDFINIPLFRKQITAIAESEIREEVEIGDSVFRSDYTLCKQIYKIIVRREMGKYNSWEDNAYWKEVKLCLQKIALVRQRYGCENISLDSCVSDEEELKKYDMIIRSIFMSGMLQLELSEDSIGESVIKSFEHKNLEAYFFIEEFCRVLVYETEKVIYILNDTFFKEEFQNIKNGALQELPANHKQQISVKLQNLLADKTLDRKLLDGVADILNIIGRAA